MTQRLSESDSELIINTDTNNIQSHTNEAGNSLACTVTLCHISHQGNPLTRSDSASGHWGGWAWELQYELEQQMTAGPWTRSDSESAVRPYGRAVPLAPWRAAGASLSCLLVSHGLTAWAEALPNSAAGCESCWLQTQLGSCSLCTRRQVTLLSQPISWPVIPLKSDSTTHHRMAQQQGPGSDRIAPTPLCQWDSDSNSPDHQSLSITQAS